MNFQQITIPHGPQSIQPPINRYGSTSSESSGIDELIDNVLNSIEEHEEKHQSKLFHSTVYSNNGCNRSNSQHSQTSSASSPQSLPLSTTELATETKIAFITHHKHEVPHISLKPHHYHHQAHNPHNYAQPHATYKIFSPNPFYPGQSLPILVQVAPSTPPNPQSPVMSLQSTHSVRSTSISPPHPYGTYASTQSLPAQRHSMLSNHSLHSIANNLEPILEDPLSKLEKVFRDRDDTNDGNLDMEEFEEAIHEIDNQINKNDLFQVFQHIAGKNNEISIAELIAYIKNEEKSAPHRAATGGGAAVTATVLFRGAFPNIFGDVNDEDLREIWGDAQMSSIHKLEKELQEEAENEGVIDFPEFEAAISNMGIKLSKAQNEKLFAHFLGEQDARDKKMGIGLRRYDTDEIMLGIDKKYELKLSFLMDILKDNVENHQHLQPKQILKLAFMELLLNCDNLNQQSSFLMKKEEAMELEEVTDGEDDDEDSFKENPDFDKEIMEINNNDNGSAEKEKLLNLPQRMDSLGKGDRSLMRMGSAQHWTDDDVIRQKEEMEQHYKMMMEQQNQNGYYL